MKKPTPEFIELFKSTPGALSVCESIAIFNLASEVPEGNYICVDVGSNHGKAAMSAAHGLSQVKLYMVDPVYDPANREAFKHSVQGVPENIPWGYVLEPSFKAKVKLIIKCASDGGMTAKLLGQHSTDALSKFLKPFSWVFLDSDDHQLDLIMSELAIIEDRMVNGGIIAFHDYLNQYSGPAEAHKYLLSTGKYENVDIPWEEIVEYVKDGDMETGNNSWHNQETPFPCFVGAVRRK